MISAEQRGVVAGVAPTRRPVAAAYSTSSTMSGRFRQSPPENTNTIGPKRRTSSIRRFASVVESSRGSRQGRDSARQWTHARSHAWVDSQMTRKGARSKSECSRMPEL